MDCEQYNQETKIPTSRMPENTPLASAYVPYQMWQEPMTPEEGFQEGTLFDELKLPFLMYGGAEND